MKTPFVNISPLFYARSVRHAAFLALFAFIFTGCFTGVEGTKKVTLSKEDRKAIQPTEEDLFFKGIKGTPLNEWQKGKEFVAADNKVLLIFDQMGLPADPDKIPLKGKTLSFEGTSEKKNPDGTRNLVIAFRCGNDTYYYDTGKKAQDALGKVYSDNIPFLIDQQMIAASRLLIQGKTLWIKSPLWYDDNNERIDGKKFVPVEILDVQPGSAVFPVKVHFKDDSGVEAWAYINFSNGALESRSFANIFSLSDIRKKYQSISSDTWKLICQGKIKTGMTKEECRLSLGNPTEVSSGHDYSQTLDLWHYTDGSVLWFEDGRLSRFRR